MTEQHDIKTDRILILDFGSQFTQLIARRVRESGVYSEIWPWDAPMDDIRCFAPKGIVLSGGPESVHVAHAPQVPPGIFDLGVPVLGVCYGMQTMCEYFGGRVVPSDEKEFGYAEVEVVAPESRLLGNMQDRNGDRGRQLLDVWMSHGDKVVQLPAGFLTTARTDTAPVAAFEHEHLPLFGVQFHPEVSHTKQGMAILSRFVHEICGCSSNWSTRNIIETHIREVREKVGTDKVLLGLSGGVDSSVVAALLHRAIGGQLTCIFVDTGLLRYQESDDVMAMFAREMDINVIRVDARNRFFSALKGETDPERKRKVIGEQFIRVFEEEARKLEGVKWLAQGTIYPDVIESAGSATGKAHVIKSHHNVGGLPADMGLKLIEPLRDLFKDEVRTLGVALGLPESMIYRHPFPGPGLGVRILGEIRPEYADILARADHIFITELRKAGWYEKTAQAFAVFLPVKSVGVVGDARRYAYVIALRAVETVDFMTARWAHLPYELLDVVSRRIINEIEDVSRVVYDISSKPPATIEWE